MLIVLLTAEVAAEEAHAGVRSSRACPDQRGPQAGLALDRRPYTSYAISLVPQILIKRLRTAGSEEQAETDANMQSPRTDSHCLCPQDADIGLVDSPRT